MHHRQSLLKFGRCARAVRFGRVGGVRRFMQVGRRIIIFVLVQVVNVVAGFDGSAKLLFGHGSVLVRRSVAHKSFQVRNRARPCGPSL